MNTTNYIQFLKEVNNINIWHKRSNTFAQGFHISKDYKGEDYFNGYIYYYKQSDGKTHKFKLNNFNRIFEVVQ